MRKNQHTFFPDHYYHVFGRTNNKEKLFRYEKNYEYFLKKYSKYLNPVLTTYAYCLLGNHFHLLVKIHPEEELNKFKKEEDEFDCHKIVTKQFATFLGTYAKAFNKQESRYGVLFQRPYKRVIITSEIKFAHIIYYIHANPELHRLVRDFKTYKWSSYSAFISDLPTKIPREEVLDWFGGLPYFLEFHEENHDFRKNSWVIE